AERLGRCGIDDEVELRRLLDRDVAWLRPAQNLVDVVAKRNCHVADGFLHPSLSPPRFFFTALAPRRLRRLHSRRQPTTGVRARPWSSPEPAAPVSTLAPYANKIRASAEGIVKPVQAARAPR